MDNRFFRLPVFLKKMARLKPAMLAVTAILFCLVTSPVLADPATSAGKTSGTDIQDEISQGKTGQTDVTPNTPGAEKAMVADGSQESPEPVPAKEHEPESDTETAHEQEQAVYPGVRNECLKLGGNDKPGVTIYYPAFGLDAVDADIASFALGLANSFIDQPDQENDPGQGGNTEDDGSGRASIEMTGFYELNRPSEKIASLTFSLYSYTGGAHGNLEIVCLNYDLANASRLALADLFASPEKALEIMSGLARKRLAAQLGNEAEEEMLETGTMPTAENFACLTLTSAGVQVEFPPYQVAPWFAGPQKVMITLPELALARPSARIWPAAARLPQDKGEPVKDEKAVRSGEGGKGVDPISQP